MIKKIIYSLLATGALLAGGGIYYVQTELAGIGLPWVSEVDLPPLDKSGNPVDTLTADSQGNIRFKTRSPYSLYNALKAFDKAEETSGMGTLYMPDNAGPDNPVPAMVIIHGSGGRRDDREDKYGKWFASQGIAGFVIDYYTPRGVTPDTKYMYKTLAASDFDIVADAYSALKLLATHPSIDANRIGVTGYSYGGMATRYTLDKRLKESMAPNTPPFALHISVYGPCFQTTGSEVTTGAPYLSIYGDQDNSVEPAFCDELHQRLRQGGSEVSVTFIPGAGHAWENEMPRKLYEEFSYVRGCEFSFIGDNILPTIDGVVQEFPGPDATRGELALNRIKPLLSAPHCIGYGYIIGRDETSDDISRASMLVFMKQHFGLN